MVWTTVRSRLLFVGGDSVVDPFDERAYKVGVFRLVECRGSTGVGYSTLGIEL